MALNQRLVMRLALAGILAGSMVLSACGRRGDVEPPPHANVTGKPVTLDNGKTVTKPNRPFILDPLI